MNELMSVHEANSVIVAILGRLSFKEVINISLVFCYLAKFGFSALPPAQSLPTTKFGHSIELSGNEHHICEEC